PDFAEIKKGSVMESGQKGASVKELQTRLSKLGFGVKATGEFGDTTEKVLKEFQKRYGVATTGKFGSTSLTAMETAEKAATVGKKLASHAKTVANNRNTVGWCYNAVADAVDNMFGSFLWGGSAYMAASQFA